MTGQHGVRSTKSSPPICYNAVERCLGQLARKALDLGTSVHMPRIGCGLAGGERNRIEPIILRQLCWERIVVHVYDYLNAG